MVQNEKELANAIMKGSSRIELSENMIGGVRKILAPSEIVWASVVTALGTSAFFFLGGVRSLCNGIRHDSRITYYINGKWRCRRYCVSYSWN